MTDNYINFVAIEELFNQERTSIQDDKSLDYTTKRMLVNELDRVWHYILQIPIRKIVSTEVQPVDRWTVVTESPKESGYYLVCDADGRCEVAKYERSEWSSIGCWTTHSIGNIEFWQSLPELPTNE